MRWDYYPCWNTFKQRKFLTKSISSQNGSLLNALNEYSKRVPPPNNELQQNYLCLFEMFDQECTDRLLDYIPQRLTHNASHSSIVLIETCLLSCQTNRTKANLI